MFSKVELIKEFGEVSTGTRTMRIHKNKIFAGHIGNPKHLEEELNQDKGFSVPLTSLDTRGVSSNDSKQIFTAFQTPLVYQSSINCEYLERCIELNLHCNFPCRIKHFFDNYGTDGYLNLGVG